MGKVESRERIIGVVERTLRLAVDVVPDAVLLVIILRLEDGLLRGVGIAVSLARIGIVDIQVVQKPEADIGSRLKAGDIALTVDGEGERLAERRQSEYFMVLARARFSVKEILAAVGRKEELICVALGFRHDITAVAVGRPLGAVDRIIGKVAQHEHLLHLRLCGLAAHVGVVKVRGGILSVVLAVRIAVPVLVARKREVRIELERSEHVRPVRHGVGNRTGIVSVDAVRLILRFFVRLSVNEPVARQFIVQIEIVDLVVENDIEGVIVHLNEPDAAVSVVLPIPRIIQMFIVYGDRDKGICHQGLAPVMVIDIVRGDPRVIRIGIFDGKVTIQSRIVDGQPLRALVPVLVGHALHAPAAPHIDVDFLARSQRFFYAGIAVRFKAVVNRLRFGIQVVARPVDGERAARVAVRTAVEHRGIEQLLHGIDVFVRLDLVAVLPYGVLIERNTPCLALIAALHAVFADIILRHVFGIGGSHLVSPLVADNGARFIVFELNVVEAHRDIAENDGIGVVLPGVRVPRCRRGRDRRLIGERFADDDIPRSALASGDGRRDRCQTLTDPFHDAARRDGGDLGIARSPCYAARCGSGKLELIADGKRRVRRLRNRRLTIPAARGKAENH